MSVTVGARHGVIDDLFVGNFLGKDCMFVFLLVFVFGWKIKILNLIAKLRFFLELAADIVFDYRQKVTRSFEHLQGDYYIAPLFMVCSGSSLFVKDDVRLG